jgi:hypothetical protein
VGSGVGVSTGGSGVPGSGVAVGGSMVGSGVGVSTGGSDVAVGSGVAVSVGLGVGLGVAVGRSAAPGPVTVYGVDALRLTPITLPRMVCEPVAAFAGIVISELARPVSATVRVLSTTYDVLVVYHWTSTRSPGANP